MQIHIDLNQIYLIIFANDNYYRPYTRPDVFGLNVQLPFILIRRVSKSNKKKERKSGSFKKKKIQACGLVTNIDETALNPHVPWR